MLISCATDSNYAELTGVMLASLKANLPDDAEIIVFGSRLRDVDRDRISACVNHSVKLSFIDLDSDKLQVFEKLPVSRHLNAVAYVRMLMPDFLPDRHERLIYLDCDVIVNRPLDILQDLDLQGLPLGAVHSQMSQKHLAEVNARLQRPEGMPYFNSGVLVVDLAEWRKRDLSRKCLDFASNFPGELQFHDQDVLNCVIGENWLKMPAEWNVGTRGLTVEQCEAAAILHFKGKLKPFHSDYVDAARQLYDKHRASTPWKSRRSIGYVERKAMGYLLKARRFVNSLTSQ